MSILNFPLYSGLVEAFKIPGPNNVTALAQIMEESKTKFTDVGLLGNFLENQDLPRWHNQSVDPQSLYNPMILTFLTDGIPIVYYGQEQGFSGSADPFNREPLWTSNYVKTATYELMSTLNKLRNFFVNTTNWASQETHILGMSEYGIAVMKGDIISVLTNIGSPVRFIHYLHLFLTDVIYNGSLEMAPTLPFLPRMQLARPLLIFSPVNSGLLELAESLTSNIPKAESPLSLSPLNS
ncbi:hypothetical protein DXG01_015095 [Tephrocybe rancida]|nr:hypothetical protein DXG01_015095 [Tephrocybe rancida]